MGFLRHVGFSFLSQVKLEKIQDVPLPYHIHTKTEDTSRTRKKAYIGTGKLYRASSAVTLAQLLLDKKRHRMRL